MTREEARDILAYAAKATSWGTPLLPNDIREAINFLLQEQEQKGLDEAAEESADKRAKSILGYSEFTYQECVDAFKAGARWMAGQGVTKDAKVEEDILEVPDMKSPFTGGKVLRGMEKKTITFRGEEYTVPQRFFKCQDTGKEFTNAAIDDDNIWEVIKAYFNRKEISPFDLIALTWEDIDKIIQFWMAVLDEMDGTKQELYTKIAELFNESRK